MAEIPSLPAQIAKRILPYIPPEDAQAHWQVIKMGEEAGEALGAFIRVAGHSRRLGTIEELALELSDVVITAYMVAELCGIDLDLAHLRKTEIVMNRPFKDKTDG